jgi:hypothetical protein
MDQLYRIITFPSFNGTRTADTLPSRKHPKTGKLMLFTSYEKAHDFIKEIKWDGIIASTYPQEFYRKVTKRYIINPNLEGTQDNLSYLEFKSQENSK